MRDRPRWVWYASPSSSDRLAPRIASGVPRVSGHAGPLQIEVRGPRRFDLPPAPGVRWQWVAPTPPDEWQRRFSGASLRIVTGSRTLLEALSVGGPFLYFNGVMDRGPRTRRHRPEKIEALLDAWRRHGVARSLRQDLLDFSRLRRAERIVERALQNPKWGSQFPPRSSAVDFPAAIADAGVLIVGWTRAWAAHSGDSEAFVRLLRSTGGRLPSRL